MSREVCRIIGFSTPERQKVFCVAQKNSADIASRADSLSTAISEFCKAVESIK